MKKRKLFCAILLSFICCGFCVHAQAASARITNRFTVLVDPGTMKASDISPILEAGDTVDINLTYSPKWVDVDVGLIAPDGMFYCFSGTNGSVNDTIEITTRGKYTFAIHNNSDSEITVSGFVSY